MKTIKLTKEFLEKVIDKTLRYWDDTNAVNEWNRPCKKSRGCLKSTYQLDVTPNGNLTFILYNFLGLFNGHYQIIVNPNTFEYKLRKYGCYATFTTISPSDDNTIYSKENLTNEQQIEIEGHIANTLHFVFYGEFRHNCHVHDINWQKFLYGKIVAEDF